MGALLLAAVLSQADSKTELLRIEEKLRSATAISTKFSSTLVIESFGKTTSIEFAGEINLTKGNRARVSFDITSGGSKWDYLMISDGATMWGHGGSRDQRDTRRKRTSPTLWPLLSIAMLRSGARFVQSSFWLALDPECDMGGLGGEFEKDGMEFKPLVEKGEERAIHYAWTYPHIPRIQEHTKIFYDPKSLLLLRRETVQVETLDPSVKAITTSRETHTDFTFDGHLAPELFKIPD